MQQSELEFIKNLRQASPYIENHRGKTLVIYLPGNMFDSEQSDIKLLQFAKDIILLNSLGIKTLLALGAEQQLNRAYTEHHISWQTHLNTRVTEKKHLPLFINTIAQVKAKFEAIFTQACSEQAADLNLISGNWVISKPKGVIEGVDFQWTGSLRKVNTQKIFNTLALNQIALITPQTYSLTGEIFNLNTLEQAFSIAKGLKADKLMVFVSHDTLSGLPKQMDLKSLQTHFSQSQSPTQKHLLAQALATEQQVNRIHIMNAQEPNAMLLELFSRDGLGTLIFMDQYHDIRRATIEDVAGILSLIQPLETQGILVPRSKERLELEINYFYVLTLDKVIIGCAALYPINSHDVELACLAISQDYQSKNLGKTLLQTLSTEATQQGYRTLFLLTTHTDHWFIEQGFKLTTIASLPQQKQSLYNYQRQSKVLVKDLTQ